MKKQDVLEKTIEKIADITELDASEITPESALMDDLELSSLEVLALCAQLETIFSITFKDEDMMKVLTVADLVDMIVYRKTV